MSNDRNPPAAPADTPGEPDTPGDLRTTGAPGEMGEPGTPGAPGEPGRHRRGSTNRWSSGLGNLVRGALIGTVEAVPGVSGGTVALVTGVYEDLIGSAGHLVSAVRRAIAGLRNRTSMSAMRTELNRVRWGVVIPVLIGMGLALVVAASQIETLYEDHPVQMRALFFGMVVVSLWVPASMVGLPWTGRELVIALAAAALAFVIVSIPPGHVDPTGPAILGSGAIAVSALVLPGLSGSFLLLTMGLYERTLEALNERDLGYLAMFALGAIIGLVSFVKLLQWLLEHRHRITLVVLTGIMAGGLRALWPWQDDDRRLLGPSEQVGATVGLFVAGAAFVLVVVLVERRVRSSESAHSLAS
jgi:putative membrane protein